MRPAALLLALLAACTPADGGDGEVGCEDLDCAIVGVAGPPAPGSIAWLGG
jgi:hypothetical protein